MASLKKIAEAAKQAFLIIKAKPGLPAIKQGVSDIGKSVDINGIKQDIQNLPVKKSVENLVETVKAKIQQLSKSSGSAPAKSVPATPAPAISAPATPAPAKSALSPSSSDNPVEKVKKTILGVVNMALAKIEELKRGGKPPFDIEAIKKNLNVDKIKKFIQNLSAKAQANLPKKPQKK